MTTGRINQGASFVFVKSAKASCARTHETARWMLEFSVTYERPERQCRTLELAQWRTNDTLRTRITCESSLSARQGYAGVNRANRGHFRFQQLPRYTRIPLRTERRTSSVHDTLRRPYERSDTAGIIVQIQTVSQKNKSIYPTLDLESIFLSSWSAKRIRRS